MKKEDPFDLENYNYSLPPSLIAQEPKALRDESRLLVVKRSTKAFKEVIFHQIIDFLAPGEVLVLNDTRVIKAKLLGKRKTGALVDILLVKPKIKGLWEALVRRAKRLKVGETIFITDELSAKVLEKTEEGKVILEFRPGEIYPILEKLGKIPLPHYIKRELENEQRYQTVYSKKEGAIAAPTAGLHFSSSLLEKIKEKQIKIVYLTLHCGLATFRPVRAKDIRQHQLEPEWVEVSSAVVEAVNEAKLRKRRVIAVGTTCVRALESAALLKEERYLVKPFSKQTSLYILPGYNFKIVDALITNFHTPCSTNLILVASFCGLELLKEAYHYAIKQKFRFFSFGDAMFIS